MLITAQEAWTSRNGGNDQVPLTMPDFVREVVEEVAFQARQDQKIDKRSGVSQRLPISLLENVVSNAERRALSTGESAVVPRVTDIYAAVPAITGKFELEYEGELKGADNVARDLIRSAVAGIFNGWFPNADHRQITEWFDRPSEAVLAAAVDFVLEGLYAQRKISRSEEGRFQAAEQVKRAPRMAVDASERDVPATGNKKKYYN
jgi:magnesium chelatase subunit I